jgi:hypothetical protein
MKLATERIRRIKADEEERFKMKLEEQKIEERRKKEKEDEEKRQMLQKVSEQRKESIKSQRNTDLSRIIEEQTQYRQRVTEPEKEVTTAKEKTRLAVTNALKMVLEDNEKKLKLLMESSKGKGSTDEKKLDQEDQGIQEDRIGKA